MKLFNKEVFVILDPSVESRPSEQFENENAQEENLEFLAQKLIMSFISLSNLLKLDNFVAFQEKRNI